MSSNKQPFTPAARVAQLRGYSVPRLQTPVDLYLDGNEGATPQIGEYLREAAGDPELSRRYPSTAELEALIARKFDVTADRVMVTAGADESIDRLCRVLLSPGKKLVFPEPSFVMFRHYVTLSEGEIVSIPWDDKPYPVDGILNAVDDDTAAVAVVTPNNPTGATVSRADVERLADSLPHTMIILDQAYAEFAQDDLTDIVIERANVVTLRSLSKAWGLAGLRIGYAIGSPELIRYMRAAGGPYSVSSLSAFVAQRVLSAADDPADDFRKRIRLETDSLYTTLNELGARPQQSEANFVFARFDNADWVRQACAGLGIAVRGFPGHPELGDALRITCPGNETDFTRLTHAVKSALSPQAMLFDLDGVIADVSKSYRQAVVQTAAAYGVTITLDDIAARKAQGGANNDWFLTQDLLAARGVEKSLDEVTDRFESIYHGSADQPGLSDTETPLVDKTFLEGLKAKLPLGVVTGRPREDAEAFLRRFDLLDLFDAMVCLEDAPNKPNPACVTLALERLGVERAWMIGDTPDDIKAARGAGVVPIGIRLPEDKTDDMTHALILAGAGRVLGNLDELKELLP